MTKIRDLMLKAGCKPELVDQICESLETYKTTLRDQYEADYTAKVTQAKKVCIDETEAHKRELSRRLQVYLETKDAAISSHLARQAALNESAATAKLRSLRSLLEGVQVGPNGQANNGSVTAVTEKAKHKIQQLSEQYNQAAALANKRNALAERVLQRNRALMVENRRLHTLLKDHGGRAPVTESRTPRPGQRIDTSRRAAQPVTSRPTIVENQDRRPAPNGTPGQTRVNGRQSGFGVTDIAANMDEDLI